MYLQESNTRSLQLDVQEANFHSSTESEVVSFDAGFRMDGIPALDPWDLVVEVSHVPSNQPKARSNLLRDKHCEKHSNARTKKQSNRSTDVGRRNVDDVTSNAYLINKSEYLGWTNVATSLHVKLSRFGALLCIFEDNDAVIKMILKVRSPTMRHVTRTYRVALDRSFNRINLDLIIQIKYVEIKNQLANMLTKG